MAIEWTIQGTREKTTYPIETFKTKRDAVRAIEAQREPKTPIYRIGHHYNFTVKKD